jgi:outer membrane biosynthesis protein TonB
MAETIGIKIANGEFYPIIDGNVKAKKRLVLTTVHNKQRSVQIDLYKSAAKTMADALYIGSLVVENIKQKPKGEPSIEMVVSSTEDGEISAEAVDLDTSSGGQHQYLSVSVQSLEGDARDEEFPDFELEQNEAPPTGLYEQTDKIKTQKREKNLWIVVIIIGVLIIALCLALWFFFIQAGSVSAGSFGAETPPSVSRPAPPQPRAEVSPQPRTEASAQAPVSAQTAIPPPASASSSTPARASTSPPAPAQTPPVISAPAQPRPPVAVQRTRPPAPVSSYKVPASIPQDGVAYRVRWGDTLWDIAAAFYRNPWLYPRIARHNGIRNPDLIVSGRTIRIPPKN